MKVVNQPIHLPVLAEKKVWLTLKREDQIHPYISGNKYRKLKYNLQEAKKQEFTTILTFGGAYSNHISATAYACNAQGLHSVGIIRGEEIAQRWEGNPTLVAARKQGMELHFVSRGQYQQKMDSSFLEALKKQFGKFYLLPEGGTNDLAVKGCEEILTREDAHFDVITGCVGTGGTLAGIINSSGLQQQILGFPALKGNFLHKDICKFVHKNNWDLVSDYHFGGYAKLDRKLIDFINWFKKETHVPLDPVYTGKMIFGVLDLVKNNYFRPGTTILAIHSGGLQGIAGMNIVLKKKNLPLIDI